MNLRHTLCATLAALLPLCTLALVPATVHAQHSAREHQVPAKPATAAATTTPRTARYCTNCATVEAVRLVGAGAEGKAPVATAGAAGAGPDARRTQRYEVIVRYASNGTAQTLQYDNDPGFRAGDAVRVNNGVLSRDQ